MTQLDYIVMQVNGNKIYPRSSSIYWPRIIYLKTCVKVLGFLYGAQYDNIRNQVIVSFANGFSTYHYGILTTINAVAINGQGVCNVTACMQSNIVLAYGVSGALMAPTSMTSKANVELSIIIVDL